MYSKNLILLYFLPAFAFTYVRGIVNGYEAQLGQFPYAVAIYADDMIICSGGVIGDKWILSVASCFTYENSFNDYIYEIHAFTNHFPDALVLNTSITIPVKTIYIPQEYDPSTNRANIAVLKLTRSLNFEGFQQLCIPSGNHTFYQVGVHAKVMGFGIHFVDRYGKWLFDSKLRYADVQIMSDSEYAKLKMPYQLDKHHFHAKITNQSDEVYGMCIADYGGPLVYKSTMILGVCIKLANDECDDREHPAIYIKVAPYLDFIRNAVKGDFTGIRVHHLLRG